jgi:hypothetical protein
MEAKELRINNLVYWNGRLERIDLNSFGTQWNNSDGRLLFEEYKAIPLTEEWLLKFGFDEITPKYYVLNIDDGNSFTYYYTFSGGVWHFEFEGISIKIKYVHELQNLYYALTKKELTIK